MINDDGYVVCDWCGYAPDCFISVTIKINAYRPFKFAVVCSAKCAAQIVPRLIETEA